MAADDRDMWAFQQEAQAAELARPPVSDAEPTARLLDEYSAHPNFRAHVQVRRRAPTAPTRLRGRSDGEGARPHSTWWTAGTR
jgi:hypothetical protein